jgi:hypothetical protein
MDHDDDDAQGFTDLLKMMPPVPRNCSISAKRSETDDDFQRWLVSRFRRTGPGRVRDVLSDAISPVLSHLLLYSAIYLVYLIVFGALYFFDLIAFLPLWLTLCSLSTFTILFSLRKRVSHCRSIASFCSGSGACVCALELVAHIFDGCIITRLRARSTATTFFFIARCAWVFVFFFVPCLHFDAATVPTHKLLWFGVKIAFLPGNSGQRVALFFGCFFLIIAAPFTFGVSYWWAYAIRIVLYYRVCGTSSSASGTL